MSDQVKKKQTKPQCCCVTAVGTGYLCPFTQPPPHVAETINNGRGEQQAAPSPPTRQLIMDAQEVPVSIRNWMTPVCKSKVETSIWAGGTREKRDKERENRFLS